MPVNSRVSALFHCIHFGSNYNPKSGLKLPKLFFQIPCSFYFHRNTRGKSPLFSVLGALLRTWRLWKIRAIWTPFMTAPLVAFRGFGL
jgi:hypothetical protein